MLKIATLTILILLISIMLVGCNNIDSDKEEKTFVAESNGMNPGIESGDILFYEKIQNKDDIVTWLQGNTSKNYEKFGNYGDVIIYYPYGKNNIGEIIHRAMCWVEVENNGSNKTYTIEAYGINQQDANEPIYLQEVGIMNYNNEPIKVDWSHSGFITKGDNLVTNFICDQVGGICDEPIKVEWIVGKVTSLK